jgi:hypothetical protein
VHCRYLRLWPKSNMILRGEKPNRHLQHLHKDCHRIVARFLFLVLASITSNLGKSPETYAILSIIILRSPNW